MSLLTVVTRVADEVGLPRPAAVATGTDQLARQMFSLANAALTDLAMMDWPVLTLQLSFPTIVDVDNYAVPAGWSRFVTDTAYVSSLYYQMRGSLSPAEWNRRQNGWPTDVGRYRYRVVGQPQRIFIQPVPQLVETITLEYQSNLLAIDTDGVRIPLYAQDTDTAIFDENLIRKALKWRIKHAKGLDYSEDFNAYETARDLMFAQQLNLPSVPVAYRSPFEIPELSDGYVPENGFGG